MISGIATATNLAFVDSPGPGALAFGLPGGSEWIILLVLGLLIFGRRLPEVGRSLGKGIVEFKRGIKGIEDEIEDESSRASTEGAKRIQDASAASRKLSSDAASRDPGEMQRGAAESSASETPARRDS
jgi:sec-independent protein translocase protein TatA